MYLSSRGKKTVVVDLDLGGANQHLYLGERTVLKHSINDFIHKRIAGLGEAMVTCKYGPGLIGGDTTYNILDFFLAADYGIVVTTRDSASYIGAYHFIKAALYRKLMRLFSPESKYASRRDPDAEHALASIMGPQDSEPSFKSVPELLEMLRELNPIAAAVADEAIREFSPCLVVNKVPPGYAASQVVDKLQGVIRRYLSREVPCLGAIPAQMEVEQSVIDLVPVVARYPQGVMARAMSEVLRNLSVQ